MKSHFLKIYKNKTVMVTGSTGFKGSWLCFWLSILGAKVVGVGLKPEKNSILFSKLKLKNKIKQFYTDINNFKNLKKIITKTKPKIIFHLAAQSIVSESFTNPIGTFTTNILGGVNLLESCRMCKVSNLVFITSDKCYLNLNAKKSYKEEDVLGGVDNYSSSKAGIENIFFSYFNSYFRKSNKLSVCTARAGNVIGGGDFKKDRIVPDIIRSIKKNKKLVLRNPDATRPWQHVLEPLSGYLLLGYFLMKRKLPNKIKPHWNFGPLNKNCKKVKIIVKHLLERVEPKKNYIIKKSNKFHESKLLSLNITKAKSELGWKPTLDFLRTMEFTSKWYQEFLNKGNLEKITEDQIRIFSSKIKYNK